MDWSLFVTYLVACGAAAMTGALFPTGPWYEALKKPAWTPPNWLFPVAWAALYLMIAIAGWLVWRAEGIGLALAVWGLQLVLNALWSVIFFGVRRLGLAMAEAGMLWASILACVVLFMPVSELAAWLMVPYLLWVSFAVVLNGAVWRLNPGPHPLITWAELKAPSPSAQARAAARAQRAQ